MAPASVRDVFPSIAVLAVTGVALSASAHIQTPRGRLLDLVQRSDVILLGTAAQVNAIGVRDSDTEVAVHEVFAGTLEDRTLTFRGPAGLAAGDRSVVFLRRTDRGFESIQAPGTIFPSRPDDDAAYRQVIGSLSRALRSEGVPDVAAVRAALIAGLSATALPLRYHAALELSALSRDGHGPTGAQREQLVALLADPTLDPALRPLLDAIVHPR